MQLIITDLAEDGISNYYIENIRIYFFNETIQELKDASTTIYVHYLVDKVEIIAVNFKLILGEVFEKHEHKN